MVFSDWLPLDYKTVAFLRTRATRAVCERKVWNECRNGEEIWRETLKISFLASHYLRVWGFRLRHSAPSEYERKNDYGATCWVLLARVLKWSTFSRNIWGWKCFKMCFSWNNVAPGHANQFNLQQHVAAGCPNARNRLPPTILLHVALKCCDRLAGAKEKFLSMSTLFISNYSIFKIHPEITIISQF